MNTRILQFLRAENLSQAQFSDVLGIQRSGLTHIISGRNKPGFDFIEKMLRSYPALNAEWLITGRGKMYKESKDDLFAPVEPPMEPPVEESPSILETDNYEQLPKVTKQVEKIIVYYTDHTYEAFGPLPNL